MAPRSSSGSPETPFIASALKASLNPAAVTLNLVLKTMFRYVSKLITEIADPVPNNAHTENPLMNRITKDALPTALSGGNTCIYVFQRKISGVCNGNIYCNHFYPWTEEHLKMQYVSRYLLKPTKNLSLLLDFLAF